jgi:hypothetical protein
MVADGCGCCKNDGCRGSKNALPQPSKKGRFIGFLMVRKHPQPCGFIGFLEYLLEQPGPVPFAGDAVCGDELPPEFAEEGAGAVGLVLVDEAE